MTTARRGVAAGADGGGRAGGGAGGCGRSRRAAWVYVAVTVGVAQAASLLIYGIAWGVRR